MFQCNVIYLCVRDICMGVPSFLAPTIWRRAFWRRRFSTECFGDKLFWRRCVLALIVLAHGLFGAKSLFWKITKSNWLTAYRHVFVYCFLCWEPQFTIKCSNQILGVITSYSLAWTSCLHSRWVINISLYKLKLNLFKDPLSRFLFYWCVDNFYFIVDNLIFMS